MHEALSTPLTPTSAAAASPSMQQHAGGRSAPGTPAPISREVSAASAFFQQQAGRSNPGTPTGLSREASSAALSAAAAMHMSPAARALRSAPGTPTKPQPRGEMFVPALIQMLECAAVDVQLDVPFVDHVLKFISTALTCESAKRNVSQPTLAADDFAFPHPPASSAFLQPHRCYSKVT